MNDTEMLLREIRATLGQFMFMPNEHSFTVTTLWIAHTHLRGIDGSFLPQRTGRLYFGSKEAGAGKTQAMELTTMMSHNGDIHVNPTQFALITALNFGQGTNGIDEIDRFFGSRGTAKVDIQTIILAGYRSGSKVSRQRNDEVEYQNIHGPMVMAGKNLNRFLTSEVFETLRTRSFIIPLERKPPDIEVTRYRSQIHERRLRQLSRGLARWGIRNGPTITSLDVDNTTERIGLDNRDEEIWSILFRIAAAAGGDWPTRIESAARAMVLGEWDEDNAPVLTPSEEMLMWVRAIFKDDEEFLPTRTIVKRVLQNSDSSIWFRDEWPNPMAATKSLAKTLHQFGIESKRHYVDGIQERGYFNSDLVNKTGETGSDAQDRFDATRQVRQVPVESWDWSTVDNEPIDLDAE